MTMASKRMNRNAVQNSFHGSDCASDRSSTAYEVVPNQGSEVVPNPGSEVVSNPGSEVVSNQGSEVVSNQGSEVVTSPNYVNCQPGSTGEEEYEIQLSSTYLHAAAVGHNGAGPVYYNSGNVCEENSDGPVISDPDSYENVPKFDMDLRGKCLDIHAIKRIAIPETATVLLLDFNQLCAVPKQVCLPSITVLSLSSQIAPKRASFSHCLALSSIRPEISAMSALKELHLNNNAIEHLPREFASLHNLSILNLNSNFITEFPVVLCDLRSIQELYLSGNFIESLPTEIARLTQLKILRLGNNRLTALPAEICALQALTCLSLRNNQLEALPRLMHGLQVMQDPTHEEQGIHLSGNPLQYPPIHLVERSIAEAVRFMKTTNPQAAVEAECPSAQVAQPEDVTSEASGQLRADISKQCPPLTSLSLTIAGQRLPGNTQILNASMNQITQIDTSIKALTKLEHLILDRNAFRDIPVTILQDLPNLKLFSLREQRRRQTKSESSSRETVAYQILREVPNTIYHCKNLKELYLSQNKIGEIIVEVTFMSGLEVLEMSDNEIKVIPEKLCEDLTNLKYLGLSGNEIGCLPQNIGGLEQLKVLRLSNNNLQALPDSICQLKGLITLSLAHNKLLYLPINFYHLKGLLPSSQGPVYDNKHIGRRFVSSLRLDNSETSMVSPSPTVWFQNGKMNIDKMFKSMEYVASHPRILQNEMEKLKRLQIKPVASVTIEKDEYQYLPDPVLRELSRQIGTEWMALGAYLGLDSQILTHIDHDYTRDMAKAIFEMLRRWRSAKIDERGELGLLDDLIEALGKPSVGRQDIRRKLINSRQSFST